MNKWIAIITACLVLWALSAVFLAAFYHLLKSIYNDHQSRR